MSEWKIQSEINRLDGDTTVFNGLAHIIEQKYDDAFSAWYGAIDIQATQQDWHAFWGRNVQLRLENGMVGNAQVLCGRAEVTYAAHQGREVGESHILYFVGISILKKPAVTEEPA